MTDDTYNQRPAVIGAVVLAALTALGLWYFLVFRPAENPELALTETPVTETVTSPAASDASFIEEQTTTSPAPETPVSAPEPTPTAANVDPTAKTGPTENIILASLSAIGASLLGLRQLKRHAPRA